MNTFVYPEQNTSLQHIAECLIFPLYLHGFDQTEKYWQQQQTASFWEDLHFIKILHFNNMHCWFCLICESSSSWQLSKHCAMCLAAKLREACFDPGNVMNGTRMGNDYKLGSMVTFHCEAGYLLQGYSTLTCVMGNSKRPEWDRTKPSCQGENHHFYNKWRPEWRKTALQLWAQYFILCGAATVLFVLKWPVKESECVMTIPCSWLGW